jgi:glycosyltransferase involved in cell wall biosynthesis
MKIVQVVSSFPPAVGGVEVHAFYLSRELARSGHKVTVITSQEPGTKDREVRSGISIVRLPAINLFGFSSVKYSPGLLIELLKADADVYCGQSYGTLHAFCASVAAVLKGKPYVFTVHGYPRLKGLAGAMQWVYKHTFAAFTFWAARKVISVTSANLPFIKKEVDPKKIVIIPNGVDTKLFKFDKGKAAQYKKQFPGRIVSYVGRLDKYKGIDILIKAFKKVKKSIPDANLIIVGKDEGIRKELKLTAERLGIEGVHFMEAVDIKEVPGIYSASDIVVLPSLYEGMSFNMMETLSCGRPFVSTRSGNAEEILSMAYGKHADDFLVKVGNSEELADKITKILKNKVKYEGIAAKGRTLIEKEFSWPKIAKETEIVYHQAVSKR